MDEPQGREHSLTVVALDVTGLDDVADRLGREVADAALAELARQLDRGVGDGSVHRTGRATFALVLAGSSADAEALLGTLQTALGPAEGEYKLRLSAGVTEIVAGDDGEGALARAEHALWQARQAGPGTVVVALAAPKAPRLARSHSGHQLCPRCRVQCGGVPRSRLPSPERVSTRRSSTRMRVLGEWR